MISVINNNIELLPGFFYVKVGKWAAVLPDVKQLQLHMDPLQQLAFKAHKAPQNNYILDS